MFLMSRIGVLNANRQCHLMESSIFGRYLRGHVFKTYRDQLPKECYFRCEEEVTCQSYNVVIGQNICELNNRTKEARPEDFMPDHMKRFGKRGTLYVPSTNFLHLHFWANLFFEFFIYDLRNSNIRERKFIDSDIFLRRAFWWFNFGDCFNIGKAFQNTETSPITETKFWNHRLINVIVGR